MRCVVSDERSTTIRLGTRGSALARWQAEWVRGQLEALGLRVELVLIETTGDVRTGPIGQMAGQGVFTKEIQRALLAGTVDLAVHSLKDLPTEAVEGLGLAAVPPRESVGDALISRQGLPFRELAPGSRVGTGSARRRAQLLALRSDLEVLDIRGNVDTRLAKLDRGEYDAIVLAEAGLRRLGLAGRITEVFSRDQLLPAIGQGALGLETRAEDEATRFWVRRLNDEVTEQAVCAERSLLAALRGGCLAPVGAWARREADQLRLDAVVLSLDGSKRLYASQTASPSDAVPLGESVAEALLDQGARSLIEAMRRTGSA